MPTFRHAGALLLGALLAAALPACNKHNAESPGNPPTGVAPRTTPDTGGTNTAPTPAAALPSPPANGAGKSTSGASGGSAQPASDAAATPYTSTPPTGQQPGR